MFCHALFPMVGFAFERILNFTGQFGENIIDRSYIVAQAFPFISQGNVYKTHIEQVFVTFSSLKQFCIGIDCFGDKLGCFTIQFFFFPLYIHGNFGIVDMQSDM